MDNRTAILLAIFLGVLCSVPFSAYANSSPSPLTYLTDPEKDYYEKVFNYTMEAIKADGKYDWASYGGKGSITVGEAYVSKSGATCRNFSENFTVQGQNGMDKGIGCKRRGKDGWCKLDLEKEAKTCSFEDSLRMFGGVNLSVPALNMPNMGISGSSSGPNYSPNVNVNTNVNTDVNTGVDKKDVTAKNYSDTVTGSAGKGAGQAASGFISWFTSTFLR